MKRLNSKFLVIFLFTLFLYSCGIHSSNKINNKITKMDEVHIKSISPYSIYRASFTNKIDIIHSQLNVKFNWENHELIGNEIIICKPYAYQMDTITLDAKSMNIENVKVNNVQVQFKYDNSYLDILLPKQINITDTQKIEINYVAMPDKKIKNGSKAITNDKGLYFINTNKKDFYKPTEIWTQGETESNSCWFPTIDKPNEKCTFDINIEVPDSLKSLSNGELVKSSKTGIFRTDYWQQTQPMSAYLVMMAIGKFNKQSETWHNKHVDYYVDINYTNAKEIFARTPAMIEYFSQKLGVAYPWNKYAQVIARDYVSGAMENTSATLHGEFVQKTNRELIDNNNDGIIAHELFHQWFGDLVTAKSWSNLTLNEGFASFGEELWSEQQNDKTEAERTAYEHLTQYINYAKILDGPLVNFYYADKENMFNSITYKKGARVLNLLRNELGENVFYKSLQKYLESFAYKNAEVHDLRRIMEEQSGRDLNPFFNQWFYKGGHPILDINYKIIDKNKLQITILQMQDSANFNFNLSTKLLYNGKSMETILPIAKKEEEFTVDYSMLNITDSTQMPIIIIDNNHTLIGEINEIKSDEAFANTFYQSTSFIDKVRVLDYFNATQSSNTVANRVYKSALKDNNKYIRYAALQRINEDFLKNKVDVDPILKNIVDKDDYSLNTQKALQFLNNYANPNYMPSYQKLCNDSSYKISGAALQCLFTLDSLQAYKMAKNLAPTAIAELRNSVANVYARIGNLEDTTYFENQLPQAFGGSRVNLMYNYLQLVCRNKSEICFNKAIQTIQKIAINDERIDIRINAVNAIEDFKTILTEKKVSIYNTTNSNIIDIVNKKLSEIFAAEKDEEVLKAYRKKEWLQ